MTKLEARIPNEARMPGNDELGHSDFNRHSGFGPRTWHHPGLWLAACGLWLLLSAECGKTQSELFTPQLVVHGLVLAGSSSVQVNVNRSYAIDEPFDTMFPGVSGVVWRGGDTWPLANSMRDVYATPELNPRPAPGDTLGIRIAKEGFDTVYGRTVVPDSFSILFPRDGDSVMVSDSMVWTRSRNCAGYYMSVQDIEQKDTSYYSLAIPNDTTGNNFDSLVFRFPQMVFLYHAKLGLHELRVYALDTNYFNWVSAGGVGFGGATSETTQLSGGLGVFGSAVGESLEVYVKAETVGRIGTERSQKSDIRMQKSEVPDLEQDGRGEGTARTIRLGSSGPGQNSDFRMSKSEVPEPKRCGRNRLRRD